MPLKEMEGGGLQESGWTMVWRTLQFAMQWLQSVERVVVVILLVHQLGTSELKDWRDVFRCVCHLFYYTFYALEQSDLLDVDNPIHLFTLQYVFLGRINTALTEWMHCFNNHPLQTEHSWSPNQMWLNGMMNSCNPLANGDLDDDPEDVTFYGEDTGHSPFEESDNNVEVSPAQISNVTTEVTNHLSNSVNPLEESSCFGVDVYVQALEIVVQTLEAYS